jgi:hypothetical protein
MPDSKLRVINTGKLISVAPPRRERTMDKRLDAMTIDELNAELARLKDNLFDVEELHSFTFGKTSVHIGAEKAQNLQIEFDEECREYNKKIADIGEALAKRGKL